MGNVLSKDKGLDDYDFSGKVAGVRKEMEKKQEETKREVQDRIIAMTKPSNPKDRAATNRLDLSLVPDSAVAYMALAFTEGDCKYGGYNWRVTGVSAYTYVAACRRHIAKWFNGEELDPVTGIPHLANALACIAVIVDAMESNKLIDDRPPFMDQAGLFARAEQMVKKLHEIYPNGVKRYVSKDTVRNGQYVSVDSNDSGSSIEPEELKKLAEEADEYIKRVLGY